MTTLFFQVYFKIIFILLVGNNPSEQKVMAPVSLQDRSSFGGISLTEIGDFGVQRKARPQIPAHLHSGIDIKRPSNNYWDEPIFPVASGTVISKRTDGPYAQLIIEHAVKGQIFWTVYEHIAGIQVFLNAEVDPSIPIARFFNKEELDQHGWQFDHFHFEVLKQKPIKIQPFSSNPDRHYQSFTLVCTNEADLMHHFHDPIHFLKQGFLKKP